MYLHVLGCSWQYDGRFCKARVLEHQAATRCATVWQVHLGTWQIHFACLGKALIGPWQKVAPTSLQTTSLTITVYAAHASYMAVIASQSLPH